ncbi:MAG TPA: 50S ribosomal protein L15 [Candidatus Saccharimonadia bacterium]|nr:50S ribosomal protein L15 [Candidatus Saccharimonadia bacterium]
MKYHELSVQKNLKASRVGRGISAGQGKTAGRGTKGQNVRTGSRKKPGFEGGSNPLVQRMPKLPGFTSHKAKVQVVYTGQLDNLKIKKITNQILFEKGLIDSDYLQVKLIVKGEIKSTMEVELQLASSGAIKQLEKVGGKFNRVTLYDKNNK